jgi:hypothetical protein
MPGALGCIMLFCVVGLAAGCSSVGPDISLSGSAAYFPVRVGGRRFHEVLADHEAAVASKLLAPRTRDEFEQSAKAPCPQALADAGLPDATTVTTADVYGLNARVVLSSACSLWVP